MTSFTSSIRGSRPFRTAQRSLMSRYSTAQVPDSGWSSENFMLGAGMVIIQPSTNKIVVIYDTEHKYWFLPRGRKDIGESLETTALREAYEESGYRVTFLPLFTLTHAPSPPSDPNARRRLNIEPLYTTIAHWPAGRGNRRLPGEYMTFWYAGQIPPDAVHETGTGMPDEQTYTSHILTYDEAINCLRGPERHVLKYVWYTYVCTLKIFEEIRANEADVGVEREADDEAENETNTCDQDLVLPRTGNTSTIRSNVTSSRTIVDSRIPKAQPQQGRADTAGRSLN